MHMNMFTFIIGNACIPSIENNRICPILTAILPEVDISCFN